VTTATDLVAPVRAAHARECSLIGGLTDAQVQAASALPGWTRGHVLGARLAFARAADRQIALAFGEREAEFYDGGRAGRDAAIEAAAARPAADLVCGLWRALEALDTAWSRIGAADWDRPVTYRGPGTLTDILFACWRESQIHLVDLRLGARPAEWSAAFCAHLFEFLAVRAPDGTRIDLSTPDGQVRTIGSGERVVVVAGTLTDLAAWLSGREPDGALEAAGELPVLRRLREARDGGRPQWA
jgi:maleylpyruvate isomerase